MKPAVSYLSIDLSQDQRKGYLFEKWVVNQFPEKDFLLREWRGDKHIGSRSAVSGMHPDLIFQCTDTEPARFFAVECKFRTRMVEDNPCWAKDYQLRNYWAFQDKYNMPVFVALGVGGGAYYPKEFSLISLSMLQTVTVPKSVRDKYKRTDFQFSRHSFIPYTKSLPVAAVQSKTEYAPTWLKKID